MSYAVKEIYYTLQGEGCRSGRAAVFLRFAGCNLWSGRDGDRSQGPGACAAWCDTDFVGTDGPGGGRFGTADDLARAVRATWPDTDGQDARPYVVCTGGEPLLQLDDALVDALHAVGFEIAIETNGTLPAPAGIDWICVSPKAGSTLVLTRGDELKVVYPQPGAEPERYASLAFRHHLLQPLDDAERDAHTAATLRYCLEHPQWRLSVQTHKWLDIP